MKRALRAWAVVVAAVGLTLGGAASGLVVPAADAATPDLTMVAAARYDVQPDHHRVHVTVNLSATNHRTDTVIRRYYVDHAFLAVLPGTTGFKVTATGSTAKPGVSVSSRTKSQVLLRIGFGTKLGSGKTLQLKLTFDLPDPGGSATRLVRVGDTLATFPVWAFGTTGAAGGAVTVSLPAGFKVEVQGGALHGPTTGAGGTQVYTSGPLSKPLTYVAYVVADRPGAYVETPLSLTVSGDPLSVVVRAWKDVAAFGKRTATLVSAGLPALGDLIGIPVPGAGAADGTALSVEEAITRAAGGYAALYDVAGQRIVVAYDALPGVVLHEAAHAWFNTALVADGWAAEGFASYYASLAAAKAKVTISPQPLTKAILAAKIPLNAWDGSGRPDPAVETYVRAASLNLARLIATRAGPVGMTTVWKAIVAGEQPDLQVGAGPGAPGGSPEAPPVAPDWRGLLDLLETRTSGSYTDLWREWVVRPDEMSLLDARAAARTSYASALGEADGWELPAAVRAYLDAWAFPAASDLIARSREVFASRPKLAAAASAAGLTLPGTAKVAFETSGPEAAATEIAAERAAIDRIVADTAARPRESDPVEAVGLIGESPDIVLAAARSAFASGDLARAVTSADAARITWDGARDAGRGRLAVAAAILAVFGVAVLLITHRRDRREVPALSPIRTMPRMMEPVRRARRFIPSRGLAAALQSRVGARPRTEPLPRPSAEAGPRAGRRAEAGRPTEAAPRAEADPRSEAAAQPTAPAQRSVVVPGRQPRPAPPAPKGLAAIFRRPAPAAPSRPPMAHRIAPPPLAGDGDDHPDGGAPPPGRPRGPDGG